MAKKIIKTLIEYLIVLALLTFICFFINKSIVMKALYKDDLRHWSWFRGLNFFDFAFKFYEMSKYRPVFEGIQYGIYVLADTEPGKILLINKIYNSFIALFIYYFVKKLDVGVIISFVCSALYLIAHFSYYQIGQGIGSLESSALFFSLIVLFFCLKLDGVIFKKSEYGNIENINNAFLIKNTICLFFMYLVVSFTHERFMSLAITILFAILLSHYDEESIISKRKILSMIIFVLIITFIFYIRYLAIGKLIPNGTGGTHVEETFDFTTFVNYCLHQVAFIFGINIGPEHLVGVEFINIDKDTRLLTIYSIALVAFVVLMYIVARIKNELYKLKSQSNVIKRNYLAGDIIFLSFIAMCIVASSVTIRIEMRFVYVSFTAAILYLVYMYSSIIEIFNNVILKYFMFLIILLIIGFRIPIELKYRSNYDKIYCFVDLKKANSIYDCTIGKYGLDDIINNKKIYIINQYYDMNNFYAEYMLKVYDKNDIGNKMNIVNSIADIPLDDIGYNTIILYEDLENMGYKQLSYEQ